MRRQLSILAMTLVLAPGAAFAQQDFGFEARSFEGSTGLTLPYRLYKVQNPTAGVKYPLILFLHGAGERGADNLAQLTANAGARVWAAAEHQAEHPAYVVAPQCPSDEQWVHTDWSMGSYSVDDVAISDPLTTALEIAGAIALEFGTDPARNYITGLSMGGYGTWDAIIRYPDRFAAALPVCGGGDPSKAQLIKDLPLWTFHGDADNVVPVSASRDMVTALMNAGSSIVYTEYPGLGHNAWDPAYANEEVIDWLFEQRRVEPPGIGGGAGSGMGGVAAGASAGGGTGLAGADSAGGSSGGAMMLSGGAPFSGAAGSSGSGAATNAGAADEGGCSFGRSPARRADFIGVALAALLVLERRAARRRRADFNAFSSSREPGT
jgi:poly(3-hydroxybutyrate) depolymerase